MLNKTSFTIQNAVYSSMITAAVFFVPGSAIADETDKLRLSGFVSIVGGKILSNSLASDYTGGTSLVGHNCPCYVADWTNGGVYGEGLSFKPESRAGIQARYALSENLDAVGQVVIRGTEVKPNVQWAYLSYSPSKSWEFQIGRKRIPLYYYSDFQDVGISYPWVNVPPEMYGWEVTNFNGVSARYKTTMAETGLTFSAFGGRESEDDAPYHGITYPGKTKVEWSNIAGGDVEMTHGPITARAIYIQAKVDTVYPEYGSYKGNLTAFGLAANLEFDEFFVLSEITRTRRTYTDGLEVKSPAITLGAGYRWGKWTPFLNLSQYQERSNDLELYEPTSYRRASFSLRYDLDRRSAFKAQLDRHYDRTRNYGGDSTIARIAYDRLF